MRLRTAFLSTFARQVFVLIVGFAAISYVSRCLGVVEFGRYSLAISISILLSSFLSLSLPSVVVYFFSSMRVDGREVELVGNGVLLLLGSVVLLVLIGLFSPAFPYVKRLDVDPLGVWVVLLFVFIQLVVMFLEAIILANKGYKEYNLLQLGSPLVFVTLLLLFLNQGSSWISVLSLNAIAAAAFLPFYVVFSSRFIKWKELKPKFGPSLQRTYLGYGLKMWSANIVTVALYRTPFLVIESYFGGRGLGVYSLAVQFSEKLWVPGRSMAAILFPERSSQASGEKEDAFGKSIKTVFANMAIVSFGVVFLYLFFDLSAVKVFGRGYEDVTRMVMMLGPGIVAWSGVTIIGAELAGRGASEANLKSSLVAFLVMLIGVLLGSRFGLHYAVLGVSAGYIAGCAASLRFFYEHKNEMRSG